MAKVSTSISIDADVKAQAQALFADFGLDLSTAINICGSRSVRIASRFPSSARFPTRTPLQLCGKLMTW